jgi:hypothetical protein
MNRAVLGKGEQTRFLGTVRQTLGIGWDELSELCDVDRRTLFNWRQEQHHIPHETLLQLSSSSGVRGRSQSRVIASALFARSNLNACFAQRFLRRCAARNDD